MALNDLPCLAKIKHGRSLNMVKICNFTYFGLVLKGTKAR